MLPGSCIAIDQQETQDNRNHQNDNTGNCKDHCLQPHGTARNETWRQYTCSISAFLLADGLHVFQLRFPACLINEWYSLFSGLTYQNGRFRHHASLNRRKTVDSCLIPVPATRFVCCLNSQHSFTRALQQTCCSADLRRDDSGSSIAAIASTRPYQNLSSDEFRKPD